MSYLTAPALEELRRTFRGARIAEFIDQVANPFFASCFASMSYFARKIGVCDRTAFRYSAKLRELGLLERKDGKRTEMPAGSTEEGQPKLRSHGYALTRLTGWLGPFVAQSLSQVAEYTARANQRKRRQWERQEERKAETKRAAVAAFNASLNIPVAVAPPMPKPRPRREEPLPSPHSWGEADAQKHLDLARWLFDDAEPIGPPETGPPE